MKHDTLKRIVAFALPGALILGLLPMVVRAEESSIGIIGGADGPTAIFVTGNWDGMIAVAAAVLCAGIGVIVALKKRRK